MGEALTIAQAKRAGINVLNKRDEFNRCIIPTINRLSKTLARSQPDSDNTNLPARSENKHKRNPRNKEKEKEKEKLNNADKPTDETTTHNNKRKLSEYEETTPRSRPKHVKTDPKSKIKNPIKKSDTIRTNHKIFEYLVTKQSEKIMQQSQQQQMQLTRTYAHALVHKDRKILIARRRIRENTRLEDNKKINIPQDMREQVLVCLRKRKKRKNTHSHKKRKGNIRMIPCTFDDNFYTLMAPSINDMICPSSSLQQVAKQQNAPENDRDELSQTRKGSTFTSTKVNQRDIREFFNKIRGQPAQTERGKGKVKQRDTPVPTSDALPEMI